MVEAFEGSENPGVEMRKVSRPRMEVLAIWGFLGTVERIGWLVTCSCFRGEGKGTRYT